MPGIDATAIRVIAEPPAAFDGPLPLRGGRDDFALPEILAQHEQDVLRAPFAGEVDELPAALQVKLAHGRLKIRQPERGEWQ